jgi:uncharacterized protein YwqG
LETPLKRVLLFPEKFAPMSIVVKPEIIKEIAQYPDMGMLRFYHKTNSELVYCPSESEHSGFEDDWAEETKKIETSPDDYFEFEKIKATLTL